MTGRYSRPSLAAHILARAPGPHPLAPAVKEFADRLSAAGVQAGCVVAVSGLHGADVLAAALAVWRLDAVVMPCPRFPESEIGWTAFRLGADRTVGAPRSQPSTARGDLATTAALHLTSGSTASPRAAKRGVASLLAEAEGYIRALSLSATDRVLVPVPLVHSFGWGVAVSALMGGCVVDAEPFVRPAPVARKMDAGVATVVALTAPLARVLADLPGRSAGTALRHIVIGAGPVSDELDEAVCGRFGIRPTRGYGSTETGGTFIGERGIGRPVPGVDIVRPRRGESGELRLSLAAPVEGYLASAEPPTWEWSTGDLVRHDHDGIVHLVGRLRPALRYNGRFIDGQCLERALRSVPGVDAVFLLALPSAAAPDVDVLYAMVAGPAVKPADIESCLARLPSDVPAPQVVRCGELPIDAIGKPDREKITMLVQGTMTV